MQLFTLLLVILLLWSLWPEILAFAHCTTGFPAGWPYADDEPDLSVSHKGGSSIPDPPKEKPISLPPMPAPQALPPPPKPPPPPTQDMAAVDQAAADAKRKAARGNGISQTLLAGETGGYNPGALGGSAGSGKKSLLG